MKNNKFTCWLGLTAVLALILALGVQTASLANSQAGAIEYREFVDAVRRGASETELNRLKEKYQRAIQKVERKVEEIEQRVEEVTEQVRSIDISVPEPEITTTWPTVPAENDGLRVSTFESGNSSRDSAAPNQSPLIDVDIPEIKYASMGVGPCGQYAMGIILDNLGYDVDMDKVFAESNPGGGSFTAPSNIQRYMRSQGVKTDIHNNSELNLITSEIDAGRPVMALISTSSEAHWVVVTGYETDDEGRVTKVKMSDSAYGNGRPSKTHEMDIDEFNEVWNKPLKNYSVVDGIVGYNRMVMTFGEKDSHKPGFTDKFGNFDTAASDAIFGGANSVVAGWHRRDPLMILGGVGQALTGLASRAVFGAPAAGLNWVGNKLSEFSQKNSGAGGIKGFLAGGAGMIGTVVNNVGTVIEKTGNVLTTGLNTVFNGIKGIFGGY